MTYALLGDQFSDWQLFPAAGGFGIIPVWGFGDVIASRHPLASIVEGRWPDAVQRVYLDTLRGRIPPDQGHMLSMTG